MSLMPVEDALQRIVGGAEPGPVELVPTADAAGRVLRQDLPARLTQPPFHSSAMDGYALRGADVPQVPATLAVIGEAAAGHAFQGELRSGQAVRIFTGAPLPAGADSVVIQENTRRENGSVTILQAPRKGEYIRRAGSDFTQGDVLLRAGKRLNARELMLAAAMNYAHLPVTRRPRVAVLATGDELTAPGSTPQPGQIISSIPAGLAAMVRQAGGDPRILGIAGDTLASLHDHIERAGDADILVTLGGASVGDHDLVQRALIERGLTLEFYKIAMRPGKPLMFGALNRLRVLGFPGNPVSALICARVFLFPLVEAMLGLRRQDLDLQTIEAMLDAPLEQNGERTHYMRARLTRDGGELRVTPAPSQDSSLMATLAMSNCLIIRQPLAPAAEPGERVHILALDF